MPTTTTIFGFMLGSVFILLFQLEAATADSDFGGACYNGDIPSLPPSPDNRTIPWGFPSIVNRTTACCSPLDQVRAGIDAVDAKLLDLLSERAALVREATRFKSLRSTVDVPSRNVEVIRKAVTNANAIHLPQTIAEAVFVAIINSSVKFELCVFDSFNTTAD